MTREPLVWGALALLVLIIVYFAVSMWMDGDYLVRKRIILKAFFDGQEHAPDAIWGRTDGLTYWTVKRTLRRMEWEGLLSSHRQGGRQLYGLTMHGNHALRPGPTSSTLH